MIGLRLVIGPRLGVASWPAARSLCRLHAILPAGSVSATTVQYHMRASPDCQEKTLPVRDQHELRSSWEPLTHWAHDDSQTQVAAIDTADRQDVLEGEVRVRMAMRKSPSDSGPAVT
jgi:hypothetical protein